MTSTGRTGVGHALARLATALLPLALSPLLLFALAEGYLDLGGGEKDLLMLLPWLVWSLLHAAAAVVLWRRHWPLGRALAAAAAFGGVTVLALWTVLFAFSL